jgi:pyridoxine kinase
MARVLALSSQVAFGSVGLAVIVPALHALGHEVIALPTVVLSNHPGYPHVAGDPLLPGQIGAMVDTLEANGWLAETAAVITGYLPSPAHVGEARSGVERVRRANRNALFLCDPVFGDDATDGLYLPEQTASAIRDTLLPLADLATPNRFELAWLTGLAVADAHGACQAARHLAIPAVLATSIPASDGRLANVLTTGAEAIACFVPRKRSAPHGTGDLLAALYLGRLLNGQAPAAALGAAVAGVEASLAAAAGRDELPLAAAGALWADVRPLPAVPV